MTILPLMVAALGGGLLAWALRDARRLSAVVGLAALVLVAVLAVVLVDLESAGPLGGEAIDLDRYDRLFIAAAATVGLLFSLVSLAVPRSRPGGEEAAGAPEGEEPSPAPAFLLFLAAAAFGLGIASPAVALLPAAAGGLAGFISIGQLTADRRQRGGRVDEVLAEAEAGVLSRRLGAEVLRIGVGLALAVTALELLVGLADTIAGAPAGVGAASLAVALAVGLRFGAVPVHAHAIRLAEHLHRAAVPVMLIWGPALFGLVALASSEAAVVPLGLPLSLERGVVAGIAVLTIAAGGIGAFVQDDIDHLVAYSMLQDAGFVMLAFASADAAIWGPARAWLLVLPVVKSALLAWALALGRTFGTRSLLELRGWARRAPLLGIALVIVGVATVGVPGFVSWDARQALLRGAFNEPVRTLVLALSLSAVLVVARIVVVGLDRPTAMVEGGPDARIRRPQPDLRRRTGATARLWLDLNRAVVSAAFVAGLALFAVGLGAGLFGVRDAASADLPAVLPGPEPTIAPSPTFQPISTFEPSPIPTASAPIGSARPTGT